MIKRFLITLINYNNWVDTIESIQSLNRIDVKNYNILVMENSATIKITTKFEMNKSISKK